MKKKKIIIKLEKENNKINNELYLLSQKMNEINKYTKSEKDKIIQNLQKKEIQM